MPKRPGESDVSLFERGNIALQEAMLRLEEINLLIQEQQAEAEKEKVELARLTTIGPVTMNMENEILKAKNKLEETAKYLANLFFEKKDLEARVVANPSSKSKDIQSRPN